jgi:hypothetical protein
MIKLEKTFVSGDGGFSNDPLTYTLVERTESAAVYERSRQGMIKDYEVFKIRVLEKGKKIFTKIVQEDTEQYPSSEQFGKTAWSYGGPAAKKAALKRFKELCKEANVIEEPKEVQPIVFPFTEPFTINQALEKNPGFIRVKVYNELQRLLSENKAVRAGEIKPTKGKPTHLYKMVLP